MQEKNGVLNDLKDKAHLLTGLFNSMEGISCAEVSERPLYPIEYNVHRHKSKKL